MKHQYRGREAGILFERVLKEAVDPSNLPVSTVLTVPLKYRVLTGEMRKCCRVVFTLNTRHYLTSTPLNERLSHRHDLAWIVYSETRREILGIISQNEASYQHPDLYFDASVDRDLILIPSAPYIVNGHPAVATSVYQTDHLRHCYRYELQIGSSSDGAFVGDRWSYREGRMCFGNWFNNKPFRWSFDGAELILPCTKGAPCAVLLDLLATTAFEVAVGGETIATFPRSSDGVRWHNEDRRVEIPRHLVSGDTVTLVFRFLGSTWESVEFNLRQEALALSRVQVDVFDLRDETLGSRVATRAWEATSEPSGSSIYNFWNNIFSRESISSILPQSVIAVAPIEFKLIEHYLAPHDQFWSTVQGLWLNLLKSGISSCVRPLDDIEVMQKCESIFVAPIRFDESAADTARMHLDDKTIAPRSGIILSHDTPTLKLAGLPTDNDALGSFAYRELFDFSLTSERKSNFWEFIITLPDYWADQHLFIYENGLIGRPRECSALLLASASAEDWYENGDPDSGLVLGIFCDLVAGNPVLMAGDLPCALAFNPNAALLAAYDGRHFAHSGGSGIARGWAPSRQRNHIAPTQTVLPTYNDAFHPSTRLFSRLAGKMSKRDSAGRTLELHGGICEKEFNHNHIYNGVIS